MKERLDRRILGALQWVDAVTQSPVQAPLSVSSSRARFFRNQRGLTIIAAAAGLEKHVSALDLSDLAAEENPAPFSIPIEGAVSDPTGSYLPRKFTLHLPMDPSPERAPDGTRPPGSLFTPIAIQLLPGPTARVLAGWAELHVTVRKAAGRRIPNVLIRAQATANGEAVLGRGMTDSRGEALVIVPGLKLFAPGENENEVTTSETEVRLQTVVPPADESVVDWTALENAAAAEGVSHEGTMKLTAGASYTRELTLP